MEKKRGIVVYCAVQYKIVTFLEKLHLIMVSDIRGLRHPLTDNPICSVYYVTGNRHLVGLLNQLFNTRLITDAGKRNMGFCQKILENWRSPE